MITPQSIQNLQVKPKWQLPVGVMESIVAHNCRKHGFPIPILAMPMWEGAGNQVIDLSGRGHHGAHINNSKWTGTSKGIGTEFPTDGGTDRINLGSIDSSNPLSGVPTGELSIVTRLYKPATGDLDNSYPRIIDKSDGGSGQNGWFLFGASLFEFTIGSSTTTPQLSITTPSSYADAGWFDIATTVKSGNNHIYIDGVDDTSVGGSGTFTFDPSTVDAAIGNWNHTIDRQWNGYISYIYIWDSILTQAQVKFLHDDPYFMFQIPEELYGYVTAVAETKDFSIDAFLQTTNTKSSIFNAILQATGTKEISIDLILEATEIKDFSADGYLVDRLDKTFSIDTLLEITTIKTFSLDAILGDIVVKTFTIDGILIGSDTKSFSINGLLKKTNSKEFTVDSILQTINDKIFTIDSHLVNRINKEFSIDTILQSVDSKDFSIDAILQSAGTGSKAFTIDAILQIVNTKDFSIDSILKSTQSKDFTLDSILEATFDKHFTLDGVLEAIQSKEFTVDGSLVNRSDKEFTTDGSIVQRYMKTFTIDAVLSGGTFKEFTIDCIIDTPKREIISLSSSITQSQELSSNITQSISISSIMELE